MSEAPVTEEFERCIVWGQVTCIPVFTPIDWRENYVVGCGQLCAECAKKQREASEQEILSHTKILRAVELSRKENNKKQTIPSIGDRKSHSVAVCVGMAFYKGRIKMREFPSLIGQMVRQTN